MRQIVLADARGLRLLPLWQALGVLLVLFVVYESLTPHPIEVPLEQGDKYGHVMAYGAQMLWFAQLYGRLGARVALAAGFVAMGVGLEFVQGMTDYRSFEVADMVADAGGVAAGWLLSPPRLPNALRFVEAHLPRRSA